ncbi:MAG: DUF6320 domain-containing protein [Eubacteriales bacterium]|nr:DUF6320 domain-containing protein [Eubacteriales bacterium]
MQRCPSCRVTVAGHKSCCPLCGGRLTGTPDPASEVFPALEKPRVTGSLVLRLLALLTIAVSVVCVLINIAQGLQVLWSLFVAVGAACVWAAAAVGIAYRRDIMQNIGWQTVLIPALSVLWDRWTGWRGWSVDLVLPCICIVAMAGMVLLAVLCRWPLRTFAGPFTSVCVIGLVPLVLALCGVVQILLPSLLCAGASLVALAAVLLFGWPTIKGELQRRFHL